MKSYKQYCGVARALDLVGQRWALLLVRELLPGPRRFTDLKLPGLTPNVLSTRLRELSEAGLIEAVELPAPASRGWALTQAGRRLEPVVLALGAFGQAYLSDPADQAMSARWLMVSLQRRYQGDLDGVDVQLWVDGQPYALGFDRGRLRVRDGEVSRPAATVRGTLAQVGPVLARGASLELDVQGDERTWQALLAGLQAGSAGAS